MKRYRTTHLSTDDVNQELFDEIELEGNNEEYVEAEDFAVEMDAEEVFEEVTTEE